MPHRRGCPNDKIPQDNSGACLSLQVAFNSKITEMGMFFRLRTVNGNLEVRGPRQRAIKPQVLRGLVAIHAGVVLWQIAICNLH